MLDIRLCMLRVTCCMLHHQAKKLYGNTDVAKREIKLVYRGWDLKLFVNSIPEEIDLQVACYIKNRTLGDGGLKPMTFELDWSTAKPSHLHKCCPDLLKDFNSARFSGL